MSFFGTTPLRTKVLLVLLSPFWLPGYIIWSFIYWLDEGFCEADEKDET